MGKEMESVRHRGEVRRDIGLLQDSENEDFSSLWRPVRFDIEVGRIDIRSILFLKASQSSVTLEDERLISGRDSAV